ncbi:MAG TPA: RimK family protein [Planctomycetota bacterium]|nr:RimK family protein [Planctomycetota bacterium]
MTRTSSTSDPESDRPPAEGGTIVVVSRPEDWPHPGRGVRVVAARDYLVDPTWTRSKRLRVFNLCRSYRYQSEGYYVSLLAAARRHRPLPDLLAVLEMRTRHGIRSIDAELDEQIQHSLGPLQSDTFTLSVYFGRNLAKRHDRLAVRLFNLFPAPLLRAQFEREERWHLTSLQPLSVAQVPDEHKSFVAAFGHEYFARARHRARGLQTPSHAIAILQDPKAEFSPSDARALARFRRAGRRLGVAVELVGKDDLARLPEFDALFIRETTRVNHHTFRFALRAEREGLAVIDDARSILRCSNKVFQAEALGARGVPVPRSWITNAPDAEEAAEKVGFPCVVKSPDGSFSQGVSLCRDDREFTLRTEELLKRSDLVVVQEFVPSQFDWRIGVLDDQPLYACRYHMAPGHWQIVRRTRTGRLRFGRVEPVPLADVPKRVVSTALRAAGAMGDGLYGVDLKELGKRVVVMEVNDNPNLEAGLEDSELGEELYARILKSLLRRVDAVEGRWERS